MEIDRKVDIIFSLLNELEYGVLFDFNFSKLKKEINLSEYREIENDLLNLDIVRIKTAPYTNETINGVSNFAINQNGINVRKDKNAIKELLKPNGKYESKNITNNFNNSTISQFNQESNFSNSPTNINNIAIEDKKRLTGKLWKLITENKLISGIILFIITEEIVWSKIWKYILELF